MLVEKFRHSPAVQELSPSLNNLPALADDILPSILVHLGILDLSECTIPALRALSSSANGPQSSLLASAPESAEPSGSEVEEVILSSEASIIIRAAAITAVDEVVARATRGEADDGSWKTKVTSAGLSAWFSGTVQERLDYRALPRYVVKGGTV